MIINKKKKRKEAYNNKSFNTMIREYDQIEVQIEDS